MKPIMSIEEYLSYCFQQESNGIERKCQEDKQKELQIARKLKKGWFKEYKKSGELEADIKRRLDKYRGSEAIHNPEFIQKYEEYVREYTVKQNKEQAHKMLKKIMKTHDYQEVDLIFFFEKSFEHTSKLLDTKTFGVLSSEGEYDGLYANKEKEDLKYWLDQDFWVDDEYFDNFIEYPLSKRVICDYLSNKMTYECDIKEKIFVSFLENNPNILCLLDLIDRQTLREDLDAYLNGLIEKIASKIISKFTFSEIEEKSLKNSPEALEAYQAYFERKDRRQKKDESMKKAKQFVLEKIPDNLIDLYPQARTLHRKFFLHVGPTNSGKTYASLQAFYGANSGVYLAPLRLLAFEIHESAMKNNIACSMITGEELIDVDGANHTSSTIEMFDASKRYDVAVIDEGQMVGDKDRGGYWAAAILGVYAPEVHICTAPEGVTLIKRLIAMCRDEVEEVAHKRTVPLVAQSETFRYPSDVRDGDALIVFSKKDVLELASDLQRRGSEVSVVYGALPYDVRREEVRRFSDGETKILVSTDAIGMGMNLPIKRVVFMKRKKYDGVSYRNLLPAEVQQIAGRAGRYGLYDCGSYVGAHSDKTFIISKMMEKPRDAQSTFLPFPKSLLESDILLSNLIVQWEAYQIKNDFIKCKGLDVNRCEYLEERFEDKHTIYDFLTIAYDENNYALGSLWQDCVQYEAERIEPPILKLLRSFECEFENALQPLETSYKKCDILYSYCRKFGHTKYLVQISEKRNKISKRIMDLLKKKQLPIRTCSNCGKRLPLFHGYGMCDECYNDMRTNRRWYGSWYDDDDDEYDDDSDDDEYDDYEDDEDCDDFEDDDYEDDDYEVY